MYIKEDMIKHLNKVLLLDKKLLRKEDSYIIKKKH